MDFTYTHRVRAILFKQMNNIASQWCIKRHRTGNHIEFCLFVCLFVFTNIYFQFSQNAMFTIFISFFYTHIKLTRYVKRGIKNTPKAFIMPIPPPFRKSGIHYPSCCSLRTCHVMHATDKYQACWVVLIV